MENTEKNEILSAIAKLGDKIDIMQKDVAKIPKLEKQISEMQKEVIKIPEMEGKITGMQNQITGMQNQISGMQNQITGMQNQITGMQNQITGMQKEIRNISKSVAVIEVEHGEKLDLFFDIFDIHSEKLKSNERRIQLCERHLNRHDDEIYYLKTLQEA